MELTPEQIKQLEQEFANPTATIPAPKPKPKQKTAAQSAAAGRLAYEKAKNQALREAIVAKKAKAEEKRLRQEPTVIDGVKVAAKPSFKQLQQAGTVQQSVVKGANAAKNLFAGKNTSTDTRSNLEKLQDVAMTGVGRGIANITPAMPLINKAHGAIIKNSPVLAKAEGKAITGVVDLASRGQYVSANIAGGLIKDVRKDPRNIAALIPGLGGLAPEAQRHMGQNAVAGLMGRKKGSYYDVLKENGVKNKVILGVLGTGGDVFLDPSTYISGGLSKPIAEAALAKGAAKAVEENVAKNAAMLAAKDYIGANGKILKAGGVARNKLVEAEREQLAKVAEETAIKAMQTANPGAVKYKIGNLDLIDSTKLYDIGKSVKEKITQSKLGNTVPKHFSTKYILPADAERVVSDVGLNATRRKIINGGIKKLEVDTAEVKKYFSVLDSREKKLISMARDRGETKALMNIPIAGDSSRTLGEFIDYASKHFDNSFTTQGTAGIRKRSIDDYVENYLPIYPNKANVQKSLRELKNDRVKIKNTPNSKGVIDHTKLMANGKSIDSADVIAKLRPTQEIDNIIAQHMQESYHKATYQQFLDEVTTQYGIQPLSKAAKKLALERGMVDRGGNTFMHKSVADALDAIEKIRVDPKINNNFIEGLTDVQNLWKFGVTGLRPGHHVTNFIGDLSTSWIDGTKLTNVYDGVKLFTGKSDIGEQLARIKRKDGTFLTLTNNELKDKYFTSGAAAGFHNADIAEDAIQHNFAGKVLSSKPVKKVRNFSEGRENSLRWAHFKSSVEDGLKRGLPDDKAFSEAADRVLKFEKDYGDFTDFEKLIKKGPIPFYAWMRKNTPLMMEMLATRPGKTIAPLKAISNLSRSLIGNGEEQYQGIAPSWQRMSKVMSNLPDGAQLLVNDKLPISDLLKYFDNPKNAGQATLADSLSPMLSVPLGLVTDAQFRKGPKPSAKRQLLNALPFGSLLGTVTEKRTNKNDGSPKKDSDEKWLAFARMMTGLGLEKSTAHQKAGQFERDNKELLKKLKEG